MSSFGFGLAFPLEDAPLLLIFLLHGHLLHAQKELGIQIDQDVMKFTGSCSPTGTDFFVPIGQWYML